MDWDDALPWTFLLFIVPFAMAIRSIVVGRRLKAQIEALTGKVAMIDHRLFRFDERLTALAGGGQIAPVPETPAAETPVAETPPMAREAQTPPVSSATPEPAATLASPPSAARPSPRPGSSFEQRFAERWLVWLGGVTLALGGAFLVKLSIDYGLLTPPVRVILAVLLGIGLCAGAEFLARREPEGEGTARGGAPVPQALAAAGSATIFAALYAAYQLYGLIPSSLAFPLLAATSIATVALSLRHGVFVAALGLVGAYAVPALVASDAPHALPLFAYLAFITAGLLAVHAPSRLVGSRLAGARRRLWLGHALAQPSSRPSRRRRWSASISWRRSASSPASGAGCRASAFSPGSPPRHRWGRWCGWPYALFAIATFVLVHVADFDTASLATAYGAASPRCSASPIATAMLDDVIVTAALLLLGGAGELASAAARRAGLVLRAAAHAGGVRRIHHRLYRGRGAAGRRRVRRPAERTAARSLGRRCR